jgi:hypothetical protein
MFWGQRIYQIDKEKLADEIIIDAMKLLYDEYRNQEVELKIIRFS